MDDWDFVESNVSDYASSVNRSLNATINEIKSPVIP